VALSHQLDNVAFDNACEHKPMAYRFWLNFISTFSMLSTWYLAEKQRAPCSVRDVSCPF
jgi:hypothetical protein